MDRDSMVGQISMIVGVLRDMLRLAMIFTRAVTNKFFHELNEHEMSKGSHEHSRASGFFPQAYKSIILAYRSILLFFVPAI